MIGCGWVQERKSPTAHLFPAAPPVLLLVVAVVHFRLLRCEVRSESPEGVFLAIVFSDVPAHPVLKIRLSLQSSSQLELFVLTF